MESIIAIIFKLLDVYSFLILLNILGSWIDPYNQSEIFRWIRKFTDPFLNMFKIIIPIGNFNLDISPIIGLMIIGLLKELIIKAFYLVAF